MSCIGVVNGEIPFSLPSSFRSCLVADREVETVVIRVVAPVTMSCIDRIGGVVHCVFAIGVGTRLSAEEYPIGGCVPPFREVVAQHRRDVVWTIERRTVFFTEVDLLDLLHRMGVGVADPSCQFAGALFQQDFKAVSVALACSDIPIDLLIAVNEASSLKSMMLYIFL